MNSATTLPVRPLHMWIVDVEREAGATAPNTPEWKRRFRVWHDAGETVTGAADMLRTMVRFAKLNEQSWETNALRAIRNARRETP